MAFTEEIIKIKGVSYTITNEAEAAKIKALLSLVDKLEELRQSWLGR